MEGAVRALNLSRFSQVEVSCAKTSIALRGHLDNP